jgi:hypothetical protein
MVPGNASTSLQGVIRVRTEMTSLGWLLLLDAAIVGLCHLLPRTRFVRPFRALIFVLVGFLSAQGVLSSAIAGLRLMPKGLFHDQLRQETLNDDGRPVVLLIGSSFTEHGVDPDLLAAKLGDTGHAAVVNRLAVGGAPHLERLHYLKEYLAHAARKPQLVLFEIAGNYDSTPLYQIDQMRFSDRMVAIMDGASVWWGLRWLADAKGPGLWERVRLGSEIVAQWALHVSHIAYLWNSAPVAAALGQKFVELPWTEPVSDKDAPRLLKEAAAAQDLRPELADRGARAVDARISRRRNGIAAALRRPALRILFGPEHAGRQRRLRAPLLCGHAAVSMLRRRGTGAARCPGAWCRLVGL